MCYRCQIIPVLLFFSSLAGGLAAQCPISVNAGPDKFVCASGGTTELEGSISGSEIGFRWTPATGLNDAGILNPTATVSSMVTYTLTGAAVDPSAPNLVNNPGFESGNTGFTSAYAYSATPINPGTYIITTSPALVLASFPPCDDHTYGNGTGNMMLCNGNGSASAKVWCQTIPVMANSWYSLSAWALCSPISPPVFQFTVNGTDVGTPYAAQPLGCVWQEFTATWFSGPATSANLCIYDVSGSGNGFFGDDFALDDIFMAKACTVSDQMKVSVASVHAVLPASVILPCSAMQTGIVLNGSGSSTGAGITYSWDGPGIASGGNTLQPTVTETGTYILTVSFDTGDGICTSEASVQVLPDPQMVMANAVANATITCNSPVVMLNGAGSSLGGLVSYDWQPASGIVSGNTTLFPMVNQAGTYTLTVTHNISGCTATTTVDVAQNTTPPIAAAAAPATLPCIAGTLTLSGAGSTTGNNIVYLWSGPGIVSGNASLNNCVVNAPGVYTLKVTNSVNGCTATATANVVQGGIPPITMAAANPPGILNCITPVLTLNSTGSNNDSTFTLLWTTPNGHFTGPVNGQTATVDTAGLYILKITNTQNGCTATDTVTVIANTTPPLVTTAADAPGALNCVTPILTLNSTGSSNDSTFTLLWTTPNGHFTGPVNGKTATVDTTGLYVLTITNTQNGCAATDTITVNANTTPPLVTTAADAPGELNCITPAITLNSSGSSNDSTFTLLWTTPNGHFTSPVNGKTAIVDTTGLYILSITSTQNGCTAADTIAVSANTTAPLAATAADAPGVLNCITPVLTLNSAGSSNDSTFTFGWTTQNGHFTGPVNGQTAMLDSAGLYHLLVTSLQNGCTATASITVLEHSEVTILPGSQGNASCFGAGNGSIAVTAEGGDNQYTYTWNNGAGTPVVNNLTAGSYTLTVVDGENCTASATFVLSQPDELFAQAQATAPSATGVSDGTASANPAGGVAPYTFLWNTGETTPLIIGLAAGLYTVTVTDANACTAEQTVQVWEGNCAVSALFSAIDPGCAGLANGQVSVTLSGGLAPYGYNWDSGGTGPVETGLAAGLHTVTATDANGCPVTVSVTLIDPPALVLAVVTVEPTSCPGLPAGSAIVVGSGGTGAIGISWSNGQSGSTASGLTDGIYIATATDANGCTDTSAVTIGAIDLQAPVIQAGASTLPLGPSGSVALTLANLGVSASDNCSQVAVQISPNEFDCTDIGVHQVTLTASDVSGNSSSVTIPVTIVDISPPAVECPVNMTICFADRLLEYNAPVAIDNCLTLGGQFALVEGLPSGSEFPVGMTTNTYTFADAQGNIGSCSFQVDVLSPLSVVKDSIIQDTGNQQSGGVLVSVAGSQADYTYAWTSNGQLIADTEDLTGVGMGTYTLLVTDAAGCTAGAGPFVVSNVSGTIIPDWTGRTGVSPNPTSGKLYLLFPAEIAGAEMEIALYDATGRLALAQHLIPQGRITLDLDRLSDGFYILSVRTAGQVGSWKIAVIR